MKTIVAEGQPVPALGFGTYQLTGATAEKMVAAALDIGYRHIDTAQMYGNEREVGNALRTSGIPRNEVFVTTKVWIDNFREGALQSSVERSLQKLQSDYVDLLLLHWPNPQIPLSETVGALSAVQSSGRCRHIGVSNFTSALFREAQAHTPHRLFGNQIEYHPFLAQTTQRALAEELGTCLTAYSPLARGAVFQDATLQEIAATHAKSPGQIALRWLIEQPTVAAIPRSRSVAHARANFSIFDFELTAEEVAAINQLSLERRRLINPEGLAPRWDD